MTACKLPNKNAMSKTREKQGMKHDTRRLTYFFQIGFCRSSGKSFFYLLFPFVELEVKCRIRQLSLQIEDRAISRTSRYFICCPICSCANETHLFIFLDRQIMRYWFAIQSNPLVNISFPRDTVVSFECVSK